MDAAARDLTSPGGTKRQALFLVPQNDPAGPKLVKGKETVPNLHRWLPLTPVSPLWLSLEFHGSVCCLLAKQEGLRNGPSCL